ncbi:Hypothetical protein R9X50_00753200 [Acrodontium crateriforme]|uniref:PQ loop repeat protein n=1 Tax=Acrodontium crateriforme TaxID=150365 RepID=A0AAQ3MAA9_9PEZI|nr:Hypothetical protein R9X50_00753200 [Acrodontium crateriforme]
MSSPLEPPTPGDCHRLQHPDGITVAFAAFITVGILASYLPQHHKIIARGSSNGLSPYWVLLGGLSSIAAIGNIMVLPASRADMKCCKDIGLGSCVAALLGVAQIGTQFCCFMLIVLLFLIYSAPLPEPKHIARQTESGQVRPARNAAVGVASIILIALFSVSFISLVMLVGWPHHTQKWANLLGIIAGLLATIQYLPQIYYTYKAKDVKSLSIITMLIQVPGAFFFALSLWLRVGNEGWSAWAVYIITACLQSVLLVMAIIFYQRETTSDASRRDSANKAVRHDNGEISTNAADDVDGTNDPEANNTNEPNETTSLLGNEHS